MLKRSAAILLSGCWLTAATALDLERADVRAFIEETSRDHNLDRKVLETLLAQAETKQSILDAISRPAEHVVPWHEYRDRFLTQKRILQGTDFWLTQGAALQRIADADIAASVVGILGVETSFGRITGRYRVLDALSTLAFDYPPRSQFFRGELQQFLILSREEALDPISALGSYAGAMGAPQFISSSYRNFAVDGDSNGRRDLWGSWDDVIASVANFLMAHGWREGEPVVVSATLDDADLSRFDTSKVALNETVRSLRGKGVRFQATVPDDAPAMLVVAQGPNGPEYRVGFTNFYVITRYNRSVMYAMAVHDLGLAILNFMQDAAR